MPVNKSVAPSLFFFSKVLIIYYIHSSVYMSVPIYPTSPFPPLGVLIFVLNPLFNSLYCAVVRMCLHILDHSLLLGNEFISSFVI